jgi:hypothetical protein
VYLLVYYFKDLLSFQVLAIHISFKHLQVISFQALNKSLKVSINLS